VYFDAELYAILKATRRFSNATKLSQFPSDSRSAILGCKMIVAVLVRPWQEQSSSEAIRLHRMKIR
jgi:hypothetical protein